MFVLNGLRKIIGLIYLHIYDEIQYRLSSLRSGPWKVCKPVQEGKIKRIIIISAGKELN